MQLDKCIERLNGLIEARAKNEAATNEKCQKASSCIADYEKQMEEAMRDGKIAAYTDAQQKKAFYESLLKNYDFLRAFTPGQKAAAAEAMDELEREYRLEVGLYFANIKSGLDAAIEARAKLDQFNAEFNSAVELYTHIDSSNAASRREKYFTGTLTTVLDKNSPEYKYVSENSASAF